MRKKGKWRIQRVGAGIFALILAATIAIGLLPQSFARAQAPDKTVDGSTIGDWEKYLTDEEGNVSTEAVGRIWTDKTVLEDSIDISASTAGKGFHIEKGESDFLVALSALSSTSNRTTVSDIPLDIVLVLDVSGSMADPLHWGSRQTKLMALQEAVNTFINTTAARNDSITKKQARHQIALVKFAGDSRTSTGNATDNNGYNYTQIVAPLQVYTSDTAKRLTDTIDSLQAGGATGADYAFERAAAALEGGRTEAKKVVVFFTDGEPNHFSGFDAAVANGAIKKAKELKKNKTLIYTIGVFDDADPGDITNRFNAYMNGVSSNYPNAIGYTGTGLGERVPSGNYYKAASSSEELNHIFEEIASEIQETATGVPTRVEAGLDGENGGYITFTDELGPYMQVDGFTDILFQDMQFSSPVTTVTKEGKKTVTTYTFTGEVSGNDIYPNGNVSHLLITVTSSETLAEGDLVEVKIPAELIPLRNFTLVETKGSPMLTVEEACPVRIFYGVSLKAGVTEDITDENGRITAPSLVKRPDSAFTAYIEENSEAGDAYFYSNAYEKGASDGSAVAGFQPAGQNDFYYFTENTPVLDQAGNPVKTIAGGQVYRYTRTCYVSDTGGKAKEVVSYTELKGTDGRTLLEQYTDTDKNGNLYIRKGTPRLIRDNDFIMKAKVSNITGTAGNSMNPVWRGEGYTDINVHLGNNGRLAVELPGTLAITKSVTGADGAHAFPFLIRLTDSEGKALSGNYTAQVRNGQKEAAVFDLAVTSGNAAYSLKAGETLYIYGLSAGDGYVVSEDKDSMPAGFTQTLPDADKAAEGRILAGETSEARFVNRYSAEMDFAAAGGLTLSKTLTGHDMAAGQFRFLVTPADKASADKLGLKEGVNEFSSPAAAEGSSASIHLLAGKTVTFTEKEAGSVYRYTIREVNDGQPGYRYDDGIRTAAIEVTDNKNGTLTVTTTVTGGTGGNKIYTYVTGQKAAEAAVIPFGNSYSASTDTEGGTKAALAVTKTLTGRPLVAGEFRFRLTAQGHPEIVIVEDAANDAEGRVDFGLLSYTTKTLEEAVNAGYAGRNADGSWTVSYTAAEKTDALPAGVTAARASFDFTVTVTDNGDGTLTAAVNLPREAGFENIYSTGTPVFVYVNGSKVLLAKEGLTPPDITGSYQFTLTGEAGAPMPEGSVDGKKTVNNDGTGNVDFGEIFFSLDSFGSEGAAEEETIGETTVAETEESLSETGPKAEPEASLEIETETALIAETEIKSEVEPETETRPETEPGTEPRTARARSKTFTYTVTETGSVLGVVNDPEAAKTFTLTVTDDGQGALTVTRNMGDTKLFAFTNTYQVTPKSSSVTDQLIVKKQLEGRGLTAGEFTFALAKDNKTIATGTCDGEGKVTFEPIEYTKPGSHTYDVYEIKGEEGKGLTFDLKHYTVNTVVTDNGDGTLSVSHTQGAGEPLVFENKYKASPTVVILGATKILNGRGLKDKEFSFQLKDAEGRVVAEAKNDGKGQIVFAPQSYHQAGTHAYTIVEVNDKKEHVTYDRGEYHVTVTVTDDGTGYLKAEVTDEGLVFTNTYKKPEEPKNPEKPTVRENPGTPDPQKNPGPTQPASTAPTGALAASGARTGDRPGVLPYVLLGALAALGAAGVLLLHRRKKHR